MTRARRILNEIEYEFIDPNEDEEEYECGFFGHEPYCTCADCNSDHDSRFCKDPDCSLCKGEERNFSKMRRLRK